jgi:hypothetical protein
MRFLVCLIKDYKNKKIYTISYKNPENIVVRLSYN